MLKHAKISKPLSIKNMMQLEIILKDNSIVQNLDNLHPSTAQIHVLASNGKTVRNSSASNI